MRVIANDRLILALDIVPDDSAELLAFVDSLTDVIRIVKIGWPLILRWDLSSAVRAMRGKNKRVFLDAKFADVESVARTLVSRCEELGVEFLTINHGWATVEAAVQTRSHGSSLKIFTITLLTNFDEEELRAQGIRKSVEEIVVERAVKAQKIGCDGVIASGREAAAIRKVTGDDFLIVTPGIRPSGVSVNDHRRAVTPSEAIAGGADYLVVGRPITNATNPRQAALDVLEEMQAAFDARVS